jgi:signal transduction histidine kinase
MMVTQPELFDEERRTAFINELGSSAKRTWLLLEDLLYWARSQQGETVYRPSALNVSELAERSIRLLAPAAKAKSVRLHSEIRTPVTVFADKDMIMTVIRNLISNALKFTPESGEIRISAVSDGKTAEISVSDTGVGISKENINRLFRSDETFTTSGIRNEKGLGFGLMLCKEFVEKNRGKIRAESTEGTGSLFVFTLPAAESV